MQTKPDLRLFKTSFSANEKIQWSFWKISKISVWSFKINNTPLLFFAFCPDVFAEGLSFLQQKQRVSSQKRWGKTIAGLCWHCLKMVWSNSYTMNTSRLTTVRKTIAPSCKWVSLWGNGGGDTHRHPHFLRETNSQGPRLAPAHACCRIPGPLLLFWFCHYSI